MHGYTPLLWAASCNRQQIVHYLVHNGANLDATTEKGFTALHLAAKNGNVAMVKELVEAGCDVGVADREGTIAPFAKMVPNIV